MTTEQKKIKRILDRHQKDFDSIGDCILEGTKEGVKKGVVSGVKKAARELLSKECLNLGVMNINGVDLLTLSEHMAKLTVSEDIIKETRDVIEGSIKEYLDRISSGIIDEFQNKIPDLEFVVKLIRQREDIIVQRLLSRLPNNPLYHAIAQGLEGTIHEITDRNIQKLSTILEEKTEGLDEEQREPPQVPAGEGKPEQAKKDLKLLITKVVAKVVEKFVYEFVIQIMRRAIADLKKKLKEKFQKKLDKIARQKLEEIAKQKFEEILNKVKLDKAINQLQEQVDKVSVDNIDFVTKIDRSFGGSFTKYLHSIIPHVTSIVVAVTVGAVIVAGGVTARNFIPESIPPPPVSVNQPPVAEPRIAWTDGLTVGFDSQGSYDPNGYVASWHWVFGDGSTSNDPNPVHAYREPGHYIATLIITDDQDKKCSPVEIAVNLAPLPEPPVILNTVLPQPSINFFAPIVKALDGTIYLARRTGESNTLYKSTDFGNNWIRLNNFPAIDGPAITDIAVSKDDPNTFYVTNGRDIWKTSNAGNTWISLPSIFDSLKLAPGLSNYGIITSIDAAHGDKTNYVLAGTSTFGKGRGDVYLMREGFGIPWIVLNVDTNRIDPWKEDLTDVFKVLFTPDFEVTQMIMAVVTNYAAGPDTYITTKVGSYRWGEYIHDVRLLTSNKSSITSPVRADIWQPFDFQAIENGEEYFVGIASLSEHEGDVFRVLNGVTAVDLDISGKDTDTSISALAGTGPSGVTLLLAGGDPGIGKPAVFRSTNNGFTWSVSIKPPSGEVWVRITRVSLVIHDDFTNNGRALAATGGFDCGVSYTMDGGTTWNHTPVTDSDIKISFSKPMDRNTTAQALTIAPQIKHEIYWKDNNQLMIIHPIAPWQRDTQYEINVTTNAKAKDGTNLEKDFHVTFFTTSS